MIWHYIHLNHKTFWMKFDFSDDSNHLFDPDIDTVTSVITFSSSSEVRMTISKTLIGRIIMHSDRKLAFELSDMYECVDEEGNAIVITTNEDDEEQRSIINRHGYYFAIETLIAKAYLNRQLRRKSTKLNHFSPKQQSKATKHLIIHHNDPDGAMSGLIAHDALGILGQNTSIITHSSGYNIDPPLDLIDQDTAVYILDFSYPRKVLEVIKDRAFSIIVLDHHEAVYEQLKGLDYVIFDNNKAGCLLTFDYFYPDQSRLTASQTHLLNLAQYVDDYDRWVFNLPDTKAVMAGLDYFTGDIKVYQWLALTSVSFEDILKTGKIVLKKNQDSIKRCISSIVNYRYLEFNWDDSWVDGDPQSGRPLKYAVFNQRDLRNEISEAILKDESLGVDYCISYYFNNRDQVVFSLRSLKDGPINVSVVARRYGGNGHQSSSGFVLSINQGLDLLKTLLSPERLV